MPRMTKEQKIGVMINIKADLCGWGALTATRLEALNAAIEALRKPDEVFDCADCEMDAAALAADLQFQLNTAEEVLKAMERERDRWADECEQEQYASLDIIQQYQHRLRNAEADLQAEREKAEKLKVWLRNNTADLYGLHEAWRTYKAVDEKILELWPDSAPEPKTLEEKIEIACNKYPDLRDLFEGK